MLPTTQIKTPRCEIHSLRGVFSEVPANEPEV